MSSTASLVLALAAGLLLVTFPGRCAGTKCPPSGSLEGPSTGRVCGECCRPGHIYPKYACSPPVTASTRAVMTLNIFEEGGDFPSECDGRFHRNSERIVALSTGWDAKGKRCGRQIRIHAKGASVLAKVVDDVNDSDRVEGKSEEGSKNLGIGREQKDCEDGLFSD